ncbi:uncharacterized protein [Miscanthus floridulus]|uniref:uncharacterized protein isoform X2 n=1 Tax=Miscanthus floridulus TaxID=154761 RepID=UPI0034587923
MYTHPDEDESSSPPKLDEVADEAIKLLSASYDTELISDRLQDAEKEDSLQLRKDNSEHGLSDEDEQIVGSLAADGSHLLNIDLNVCSARFHCFTLPEIRTILQRDKPTVVCISGVERLRESTEVLDLIKGKHERSKDCCFPKAGRIISLTETNDELDDLKANLLPNVSPWKGFAYRKGNTSITSKVMKKVKKISKLAKQLQKNKKVQGLIALELCELIEMDYPNYLKDHLEELVVQVETEQDRPVWFYP